MRDTNTKISYWSNLVGNITEFGSNVTDEARNLFSKPRVETFSTEYLFDPHVTLQRSYGTLAHGTDYADSPVSPNPSRRGSDTAYDIDSQPSEEDEPITMDPLQISPSHPSDDFPTERGVMQKRERQFIIPIINIHPEQDFNFLTVDSAITNGGNGRMTPARKSSVLLSSPASPMTMSSSFEFNSQENVIPDKFTWGRILKIIFLVAIFVIVSCVIISTTEEHPTFKLITVSSAQNFMFPIRISKAIVTYYPVLTLGLNGAFIPNQYKNLSENRLTVEIQKKDRDGNMVEVPLAGEKWEIPIFDAPNVDLMLTETTIFHDFNLHLVDWEYGSDYYIVFETDTVASIPFSVSGRLLSQVVEVGAIFGGAVIVGLYILIIFELVNRTLAAMLAAAGAIGCLSAINERPTMAEMASWIDLETISLLFSMMVIVSLLCETGFFDYASFIMYKIAKGKVWPVITALCFFTAIVSAFLDNVTTILLMTPVTIRICEAMELNPVPILISIVIFSNIGGAATPVGDPPNVIIASNKDVMAAGIDFTVFSMHMSLGIVPIILVAYLQLRFIFRNMKSLKFSEPYEITELRREIDVWSRAADSLSSYSRDERQVRVLLLSKVVHLQNKLKTKVVMGGQSQENFQANLIELEATCKIRDWPLLIKCGVVLAIVILLFFLHSIPHLNLSIGWTSLLGAVFLLILADRREIEGILCRVEWSTLIFFSALFIVMEGVARMGLLEWIGNQTEAIILDVKEEARTTAAMLLILWISGLASAFIDNIPFTTMMIKIVTRLADRVSLPLQPLIWALALGTCLGGNGTLIGASANVVAAGVAEQHGYKFTFMEYFKIGFPMMIISLIVSTVYLYICHTLLEWNY